MCTVCGCEAGETKVGSEVHEDSHEHTHAHEDGSEHSHAHTHVGEHAHAHGHEHHHHEHGIAADLDYGTGPARAHAPGLSQSRRISWARTTPMRRPIASGLTNGESLR